MSYKTDIRDALRTIIGANNGGEDMFSAVVDSVSIETRSCSVTTISNDVEVELPNVWLMADIDNGQLIVPKVGSTVLIANNSQLQPFVLMFSEIDSAWWVVGNSQFKITDGLIQANDGSNGGLTITPELKKQLDKTNTVLTAIANTLQTWTPVAGDGGAALKAAIIAALTGKTVGDFSNIEDKKFTH